MKTAVAGRAHRSTRKLASLLEPLSGYSEYAFFRIANEARRRVDAPGVTKLVHTADILAPSGDSYAKEGRLVHCTDAVCGLLRAVLPDQDFIVVIEDDVHFRSGARQFADRVIDAARMQPVDLVRAKSKVPIRAGSGMPNRSTPSTSTASSFRLSGCRRAPSINSPGRRRETCDLTAEGRVFCETFVPSALTLSGETVIKDVDDLGFNACRHDLFHPWLPYPLEDPVWETATVGMIHPMSSAAEYLDRIFWCQDKAQVIAVITELGWRQFAIPPTLRLEYAARPTAVLRATLIERIDRLEGHGVPPGR